MTELVRAALDEAIRHAERAQGEASHAGETALGPTVTALDAGCGRRSVLAPYRPWLARLVGADVRPPPEGVSRSLDQLVVADVCTDGAAFEAGVFDVILGSFLVEHLADPPAAFANFARWLRPRGALVLTTVNRRHPFVAAYILLPDVIRRRLQPIVKAERTDAHALVGACNDPAALRAALAAAGFVDIRVATVDNLGRAWARTLPTLVAGVVGDLLVRGHPSRRSTLVVTARTSATSGGHATAIAG